MISHTLSGLAIRPAEGVPGVGHTRLSHTHQNFGPGDSLGIYVDQRLPPISDLLRDVPPPPVQPHCYPAFPPSPLPSPIGPSPSLFPAPYPNWSMLPPRPQSVSGQYPGFLPPTPSLGPRRASTDCIGRDTNPASRSYSAPYRTPFHHHRASPDRERDRQRRSTKCHARLRRGSSSSDSESDHRPTAPYTFPTTSLEGRTTAATRRQQHQHQHTTKPNPTNQVATTIAAAAVAPKEGRRLGGARRGAGKRNNQPYTFEQEAFFIYHRVDLNLPWDQVRAAFMARWPHLRRSVSGLECVYYRTNGCLPAVTPDGLLVLVDPAVDFPEGGEGVGDGAMTPPGTPEALPSPVDNANTNTDANAEGEGEAGEMGDGKGKRVWYKVYKGVAYRTRQVKCRKARFSLMERFPEELVDERNDWVREEHRVEARALAERRRRQREEWLAARAGQQQQQQDQRVMHF